MKFSMFIFLCLLSSLFQHSHSTTILVDGVSEWKNPTVHVGDSISKFPKLNCNPRIFFFFFFLNDLIKVTWAALYTNTLVLNISVFKHKFHYNLYIFQNQRAFNVCNFTQATLLNKPDSTSYTVWYLFLFSFRQRHTKHVYLIFL